MYTMRVVLFLTVSSVIRAILLDMIYVEAEIPEESITNHNILGYRMCLLRCGRTCNCRSLYFDQNLLECRLYDHQLKNYTKVLESRKVIGLESYVKQFAKRCGEDDCSEDAVCVPPSKYRHQSVCVDVEKSNDDVKSEKPRVCSGQAHMTIYHAPTIFRLNSANVRENYCALAASTAFPRMLYLLRGGHLIRGILEVYSLDKKRNVCRIEITVFSERRYDFWSDVTVGAAEDDNEYWIYVALEDRVVRFKEMKTRPSRKIQIGESQYELFAIERRESAAPINSQEHIAITRTGRQGLFILENGRIHVVHVEQGHLQEQMQSGFDRFEIDGVKAVSFAARSYRLIIYTSKFCLLELATKRAKIIDIRALHDVPILDVELDPAGTHVYILSSKRIRKYPVPLE